MVVSVQAHSRTIALISPYRLRCEKEQHMSLRGQGASSPAGRAGKLSSGGRRMKSPQVRWMRCRPYPGCHPGGRRRRHKTVPCRASAGRSRILMLMNRLDRGDISSSRARNTKVIRAVGGGMGNAWSCKVELADLYFGTSNRLSLTNDISWA